MPSIIRVSYGMIVLILMVMFTGVWIHSVYVPEKETAAQRDGYIKGLADGQKEDRISYCLQGSGQANSLCITEKGLRVTCNGEVTECLNGTLALYVTPKK